MKLYEIRKIFLLINLFKASRNFQNLFLIILIVWFVKELSKIQLSAYNNVKNVFALNVPRSGKVGELHVHPTAKDLSNFNQVILDLKIFLLKPNLNVILDNAMKWMNIWKPVSIPAHVNLLKCLVINYAMKSFSIEKLNSINYKIASTQNSYALNVIKSSYITY